MRGLAVFLCLLLCHCASSVDRIANTGVEVIHFGSGGGFTGETVGYTLNANGTLSKNGEPIGRLCAERTLAYFKQAKDFSQYQFKHPGNIYNFIEITSSGTSNRIVWSANSEGIHKDIINLHKQLLLETNLIYEEDQ